MKVRSGFVSNSSSSSFVFLGIKKSTEELEKQFVQDKDKDDVHEIIEEQSNANNIDFLYNDYTNSWMFGNLLEDSGCDGEIGSGEIQITDLFIKELANKINKMFPEITTNDIFLMYGVRAA